MSFIPFQQTYIQHALAAGLCAGASCGLVGVFVVAMHLSFLGVCIAHAAFAGALMGVWLQWNPLVCATAFSLIAACVVGPLADRGELTPDTSVGVIFSLMLGLAFLFLGLTPGSKTEALALFWGSILTVSRQDLIVLILTTLVVGSLVLLFFKEIQAVVCHRRTAIAVGIPASVVFYGMLLAAAGTVAVSLPSMGGLLIYSLILNPAAAAYQLSYRLRTVFLLAALFGVVSSWMGLFASYVWDLPAAASIVLVSSALFGLALVFSPKRRSLSVHTQADAET